MKNKQEISSGDNSTNIQGSDVTVNQYGIKYSDVKEVAMDVFKSNFYDLGEKIERIVNERAEGIINKYLDKLQSIAPESLPNTEDPDLRYAIYETQKNHARRGDNDIADLLVDVLVSRTKVKDEAFLKLVTNEALEIIPKLTLKQIDILTFIFLMRYVNLGGIIPINNFYDVISVFTDEIPNEEVFYQHLQYTGCISISIGSVDFEKLIKGNYPKQFNQSGNNNFRQELHQVNQGLSAIMDKWGNTKLCNSSLTSVGIAIALSNLKRKLGVNWGLEIWIKE